MVASTDGWNSIESIEQGADQFEMIIGRQVADAMKFGNKDLAIKLSMQIPLDLPTARVLKADWGVERLKNFGFNLDDVVAAYGKEWLEA